ncbi:2-hydroxyacid dehydrogenase [Paenibacillus xerothermodurans]|nr:2-hydroxyacid dehydrogenase [Paenibacillus xerothermodurans]
MSSKKVIYFDKVFEEFKQLLQEHTPPGFELWYWQEMDAGEREAKLALADYLLVATTKMDEAICAKAEKARYIQKTGIGVDNIDLEAAGKYGLPVSNTPGGNATGVAELTILLALALYRKIVQVNEATKNGRWLMWELRPSSYEMEGKTHGFIGFGNIGRETAKRSRAFGTELIYYDKYRAPEHVEAELGAAYCSMEEVLRRSDILSLHIPLLPETRGLIGTRELQMMKPTAILLNMARGGIVKEAELYQALQAGVIAGAGIDAWESEPTDPANPLLTLDNVIASPHIGAGTRDTLNKVLTLAFQNMVRVDQGLAPQFVVNGVRTARNSVQ